MARFTVDGDGSTAPERDHMRGNPCIPLATADRGTLRSSGDIPRRHGKDA